VIAKEIKGTENSSGVWTPQFIGNVLQMTEYRFRGQTYSIPETDVSGMVNGDRYYVCDNPKEFKLFKGDGTGQFTDIYTDDRSPTGNMKSSAGPLIWRENDETYYLHIMED